MYGLDKFIQVIYRDMDIKEILEKISNSSQYDNWFDLSNDIFEDFVVQKFLQRFPDNHSEDEVRHLYYIFLERIDNNYANNFKTNSINLIGIISNFFLNTSNRNNIVYFNKLLGWDKYINIIDINIILAFYKAENKCDFNNTSNILKHDNQRLYNILNKGYGDTHMHFQASGYSTEINWYQYINVPFKKMFVEDNYSEFIYHNFYDYNFKKEKELLFKIKLKFIRMYLYDRVRNSRFDVDLNINIKSRKKRVFKKNDLNNILKAKKVIDFDKYSLKENKMLEYYQVDFDYLGDDIFNYVIFERGFLTGLFKLVLSDEVNRKELLITNLYLISLTQFKFEFIQDNLGMGFEKFKKLENRKKLFITGKIKYDLYRSVFDKYYREGSVKFIEMRIGPKDKKSMITFINEINQINNNSHSKFKKAYPNIKKIEYGIIIHYIKDKAPIDFDEFKSRKNDFLEKSKEESKKLSDFLDMPVELNSNIDITQLKNEKNTNIYETFEKTNFNKPINWATTKSKIIGIDAANYELNCRPENLGPLFRKHRMEYGVLKSFGITYHVGEEFLTLANGLRAIDEAIEFLNMKRGDRLGHAIALGIDAEDYFSVKKRIINTTLQDYLDDLVWMRNILYNSDVILCNELHFLENEIKKYIQKLYKDIDYKPSIDAYSRSLYLRGDLPDLYLDSIDVVSSRGYKEIKNKKENKYNLNFESHNHMSAFIDQSVRKIYRQYHFNKSIKKAGSKRMKLLAQDIYISIIHKIQKILKSKIISLGIAVEINPSSNKKISYAKKIDKIQLLGLNNRYLEKCDMELDNNGIPVTINTDDSAIFQTNLKNEYSLIAAHLINEGYSDESVYEYIDYLRSLSLDLKF